MNLHKAERRDRQRHKKKNGMKITGRSIFVIVQTQVDKAKGGKRNGKKKRKSR